MSLATLFDYGALDAETRIVVQQKTGEIRERIKRTANDIVEIGERLIEIKERLGHGQFGEWLKAEFEWDERTARRLISVADTFKSDKLSVLGIAPSALYALSAPSTPEPARKEAIDQAKAGKTISHGDAKTIIDKHRQSPAAPPKKPSPAPAPNVLDHSADEEPAYENESQEEEEDQEEAFGLDAENPQTAAPIDPEEASRLWIKFIDSMRLFLVSLPRRGGILGLTKIWPKRRVNSVLDNLKELRTTVDQAIHELERGRK